MYFMISVSQKNRVFTGVKRKIDELNGTKWDSTSATTPYLAWRRRKQQEALSLGALLRHMRNKIEIQVLEWVVRE